MDDNSHIDYNENSPIINQYIKSLENHIGYVREAGKLLGVPELQLDEHDRSKWSDAEFLPYANHFFGEDDPIAFQKAWLHHLHHNHHHWQHWIIPGSEGGGIVEIPHHYALEMIADWLGASMAYTDSWDMSEWLAENANSIILHPYTSAYVNLVLYNLGYGYTEFKTVLDG